MMILVNELERENRDIQSNERVEIKANRNAFDLIGEKFQGTTIRVVWMKMESADNTYTRVTQITEIHHPLP